MDKITGTMKSSQRNKIYLVRDTIFALTEQLGEIIPLEKIQEKLEGKMTESELEEAIQKLKEKGDIYEPRRRYYQKM